MRSCSSHLIYYYNCTTVPRLLPLPPSLPSSVHLSVCVSVCARLELLCAIVAHYVDSWEPRTQCMPYWSDYSPPPPSSTRNCYYRPTHPPSPRCDIVLVQKLKHLGVKLNCWPTCFCCRLQIFVICYYRRFFNLWNIWNSLELSVENRSIFIGVSVIVLLKGTFLTRLLSFNSKQVCIHLMELHVGSRYDDDSLLQGVILRRRKVCL